MPLSSVVAVLADKWVKWDKNEETRAFVQKLVNEENEESLQSILVNRIKFGTAGLRARMGPGFSQLNDLVIIQTTQGLANTILNSFDETTIRRGVVVGFDKRHNSERFAKLTASVFLCSGIPVALFSDYVATPFVAFATKKYSHIAGVMITASHNPKEDNGYKLYWANGAQIIPPIDECIQSCIEQHLEPREGVWSYDNVLAKGKHDGTLTDPLDQCTRDYLDDLTLLNDFQLHGEALDKAPCFTYTAMHGVGHKFLISAFQKLELQPFVSVVEQCEPDPEFPTVRFPNPEEGEGALGLAMQTANNNNSTVILANDPDADRLAVGEKLGDGKWKILSGNELGTLIGWWLLEQHKRKIAHNETKVKLEDCVMLSSAVSSRILASMAEKDGFQFEETLTGFKWMGNRADDLIKTENKTVLFAFEEAIGYMCGSTVLDKDGISAACVVAQMTNYLYSNSSTLVEQLSKIYATYGVHVSYNSYYFCHDLNIITAIFNRIRNYENETGADSKAADGYPKYLNGIPLSSVRDLTVGIDSGEPDQRPKLPTCSSSQMITFYLSNGIVTTIRTSGTEPKIKFYSELYDKSKMFSKTADAQMFLKMHMNIIIKFLLEPGKNNLKPAEALK